MGESEKNKAQAKLMSMIQEIIPSNYSLVDVLSDALGVSNDSAYRRIRGETALTIDEAAILCKKFKISFDSYINSESTSVSFRYSPLDNIEDYRVYLSSILEDMQQIQKAQSPKITYAAIDVPIFHNFKYPDLASFKLFYWLTAVIDEKTLIGQKFDSSIIMPELKEIGSQIYELYCQIPSIEIWSEETVNSLIKQIEFYWDSGKFRKKEDALIVCEQVREQFDVLQKQAQNCSKLTEEECKDNNNFELYLSDIEIGNNCIQVTKGSAKNIYLTFNTFNALVTGNEGFCNAINGWLDNLIRKATLISGISEKLRYKFFKAIFEKLDSLVQRIESY